MTPCSRRAFVTASAGFGAGVLLPATAAGTRPEIRVASDGDGYDPWLEVDPGAVRANVRATAGLAGGRPVLAVVKNNAYGLGLAVIGPLVDAAPEVGALAVVKADEALTLRAAGVRKPILVMGAVSDAEAVELVRRDVRLAPFDDGADRRLAAVARAAGRPVAVHLDIDTGMQRVGLSWRRAVDWAARVAGAPDIRIEGAYTTFAEHAEHDAEQLARFRRVVDEARARGVGLGLLHAASSHGLFFLPEEARLDAVRPGLALYGAYPAGAAALDRAVLTPAFRLRARVVRVERLEPGDAVSYGRNYIADRPVWIATLPVGHADGYPRAAVRGCEVLIGGRVYPVIGAVSASHTIVEVGAARTVEVGDTATLVGPDHDAILPNRIAERAGISVYDVLMHLSARLPVRVRDG
jgi:alanine racemase